MGCRQKISCLMVALLVGVFWWMPGNRPVMGQEPIQAEQDDISHWLSELEDHLSDSGKKKDAPDVRPNDADTPSWDTSKAADSTDASKAADSTGKATDGSEGPKKISIDFFKIDLHNVFRLLGQISGKNIVVDEEVKGTLTLALQDVPWPFVLEVIKNLKELESIERHNTIMIYPADKKITWAGEAGSTGTLDIELGALEVDVDIDQMSSLIEDDNKTAEGLFMERTAGFQTPLDQVVHAQNMIKKAAAFEKQGSMKQALDFYRNASDSWPNNISLAKKVAALALGQTGDEITALNYARQILRFMPKESEAAMFAGMALARMGKTDDAKAYFTRATYTEKLSQQVMYNYAVFCESVGEYRDSLRMLNRIENTGEITVDIMLLRADIYEKLGQPDRAVKEYRAVLHSGTELSLLARQHAECRLKHLDPEKK